MGKVGTLDPELVMAASADPYLRWEIAAPVSPLGRAGFLAVWKPVSFRGVRKGAPTGPKGEADFHCRGIAAKAPSEGPAMRCHDFRMPAGGYWG